MNISVNEIPRVIDISAVQAFHGKDDIVQMIAYAKKYKFINAHVLPSWVAFAVQLLEGETEVLVGSPIGFPSGGAKTSIKLAEERELIKDGAGEMDLVMNIGRFKSADYAYVLDEIKAVVGEAGNLPLKVILEVHHLTPDEIKRACELCIEGGADFVKTGTGWTPSGTTIDAVRDIIRFTGGKIKVKASGGIRGYAMLNEMHRMGVARFGINIQSAVSIIREAESRGESQ